MKVIKFGGTSLATAKQVEKACSIIMADPNRKLVVVSAPGKRFEDDTKVTDLLISLGCACINGDDVQGPLEEVANRFEDIITGLKMPDENIIYVREYLANRMNTDVSDNKKFMDAMKAAGEDVCARIVASYLQSLGCECKYTNPGKAGMLLSKEYGNAVVLPEAYEKLSKLKEYKGISVLPGFFGYSTDGEIVTF